MRLGLTALALAVTASACNPTSDVLSGPFDTRFASNLRTASLDTFIDCSDLISHVKAEALERVGPWGLEGGTSARPIPAGETLPSGVAPPTAADQPTHTSDAGGRVFTSTEGSSEQPDLAKAVGDRMLTVRGNSLVQLDLSTSSPTISGTLRLADGTLADRLVVDGDTALVLSTDWVPTTLASGPAPGISLPYLPSTPRTVIHQIDIADPANMAVVATLTLDATVLAAATDEGDLRLVLEHRPDDLGFVLPSGVSTAEAANINRRTVADSALAAWFGGYELTRDGRSLTGQLTSCDDIHEAPLFSGFSTVTMLSLPIDGNLIPTGAVSLLGDPMAVATNESGATVATNKWVPIDASEVTLLAAERDYRTDLHTFAIASAGSADYTASGSIAGHPLDVGALADHNGVITIAVRDGAPWGTATTTSLVSIERRGNRLNERGRAENPNGSTMTRNVRFIADRAYAGSLQQSEPLRLVDLSSPDRPRLAATLAMPGFSSHLEPIGTNRIIGVGQNIDSATGRSEGLRISLFDVTDADRPRVLASKTYADGSSAAQWDPRTVTWSPEQRVLVLPIETRSADSVSGRTEAIAVRVSDNAISEIGRVTHDGGTIDRSIVHRNQVLTLSYIGVQASRITDLDPISWTPLTF